MIEQALAFMIYTMGFALIAVVLVGLYLTVMEVRCD